MDRDIKYIPGLYLTLTRVVFEQCKKPSKKFIVSDLTLTRVVFEQT